MPVQAVQIPPRAATRVLACLLLLSLSGCAHLVRRMLIIHEAVTEKVGPNHVTVRFSRAFLEANRERITLQTEFTVDVAARMINPAVFDGDIHIAGRSPDIGLRMVAEIMNAKTAPAAVAMVRRAQATRRPIRLVAVPRYWPEHAIGVPHRQGEPMPRLANANPDHLFELHPVIEVEGLDLRYTLHPVEGYRPFHAATAFDHLDHADVQFRIQGDSVLVRTSAGLWNDVHFVLELTDRPARVLEDGAYLTGRARDLAGNVLRDSVRVVLVGGSPPDRAIRGMPPRTWIHVWGQPRVSLDGLVSLIEAAAADTTSHTAAMPYEVVIVGVYPKGQ